MANATNTIAGDVQLSGDLAGNNNAAAPALTTVNASPGAYIVSNITVDSKGRVTAASNGTESDIRNLLPIATTTAIGAVKIGSGLSVDVNGLLSANPSDATYVSKGIVQIQANAGLSVVNGVLSASTATNSTLGVVKIGSGLSVDVNGVLSADPFPIATNSTLGVVKIGSGLSVDVNGVLSLNAPIATDTILGVVKIGSGLSVDVNGVLSLNAPTATNSTLGVVQIGSGLSVDVNGSVSLTGEVAYKNLTNIFTQRLTIQAVALSTASNPIAVDGSQSNLYTVTLTSNFTLSNPTNLQPGEYTFIIKQDAVGGRTLSFGTAYKFKTVYGVNTLSTAANATDIITCISDGTNLYCSLTKGY